MIIGQACAIIFISSPTKTDHIILTQYNNILGASRNSYKRVCIFYTMFIRVHKCCINVCLSSINFYTCINLYIFYARIKISTCIKKYQPETSQADIFYTHLYSV